MTQNEKQCAAWYTLHVLKPQIDELPAEAKTYLWKLLLNDVHFDKVREDIAQYLFMHKNDIEKAKDMLGKNLFESLLDLSKKERYIQQTESLSELEKALVDFYNARTIMPERTDGSVDNYSLQELLSIYAAQIKDIAREEAIKKLPAWKKAAKDINSNTIDYAIKCLNNGGDSRDFETVEITNRIRQGEFYVELRDLIELPIYEEPK